MIRLRLCTLVAAVFLTLLPASGQTDIAIPSGPRETLGLMQDAMTRAAPDLPVTLDETDLSLAVTLPGGETTTLYPDNLDMALRAEPDATRRQEIFDRHMAAVIASFDETGAESEVDPASVMPVIRDRLRLAAALPEEPPLLPFAGGLIQYWVVDQPEWTASLDKDMMKVLALDPDGLASLSQSNLAARLKEMTISQTGPYYQVRLDGYYESSLLLISALWEERAKGHQSLIAAIPTRDTLIWIADGSPDDIAALRGLAGTSWESGAYAVSPDLFSWTGEGWVVLAE
ncbi:hypothetical protein [Pseudogemmobacter bohemicus]|uniref:hypothetical protein n=1 Tax=Pseudogemmobacter bohemicus TaxID=2250708 RepID=UPI00130046E6|nr:hypothetical protein [Pseudogemmobacter bohemicus]